MATTTPRADGIPAPNATNLSKPTRQRSWADPPRARAKGCLLLASSGGRFRVVRFIAHGGMGEVYEAEDLELRERVALKTIRPSIARDEESIERFRREIHLARKVTHENVCRIFDLFRHPVPDGSGDLSFLTMELLPGETLSRRLKRTGRMDAGDALPLLEQMAAALHAAHRAGVVHRDFKPDNVMIVEGKDRLRAVVTDFGLSRSHALDPAAESVTETGAFIGTPAYMSPEQVEGKEVTPASDVYSLGLVAYEMVTGERPFADASPLVNAAARVKDLPTRPRKHAPKLSASWEAAILKCLNRDPQNRFPSAAAVIEALHGVRTAEPRAARKPVLFVAALLLMALGVGVFTWMNRERATGNTVPDVSSMRPRRAVAVLGFQNLSGNPDVAWLSTALSEMLGSELAVGNELRVVPGERVAQMRNDLSLSGSERFEPEDLRRVRAHLDVDFVVFGSYVALGDAGAHVRLDLRLQETNGAEIVGSVRGAGTMTDLFDLVSQVGTSLREQAGLASAAGVAVRSAALPSGAEAARLYADGLAEFREFEYLQAKSSLEAALEAEPDSPLIQSVLAQAWWELGYTERAQEFATEAYEQSKELPLKERLGIEARYRRYLGSTREREKAANIYRTLWSSFPDEIEYGLQLVRAQPSFKALETLEQLRKLPPPLGSDPRIFLLEAEVRDDLGDSPSALEAARRAAEEARARNARLILAEALLLEGASHRELGDIEDALETLEKAKTLFAAAGNPVGMARTLREIARSNTGVSAAAVRRPISEAVALSREVGALPQAADALSWLAQVAANEGDFPDAERLLDEAGAIWEEVGDDIDIASGLGTKSFTLYLKGDLRGAEEAAGEALERLRNVGDDETIRYAYFDLGRIHRDRGDLNSAEEMFSGALEIDRRLGRIGEVRADLRALAIVFGEQARFDEAVSALEEALAISEKTGDPLDHANLYLVLADYRRTQGRWEEARAYLEQAKTLYSDQQEYLWVSSVTADLAILHRDEGDVAGFERLLSEAIEKGRPFLNSVDAEDQPLDGYGFALLAGGAHDAAQQAFEASLSFSQRTSNRLEASFALQRLGGLQRARGELKEAKKLYEEALFLQRQLPGSYKDVDGLYLLATVEADLGQLESARSAIRTIIATSSDLGLDRDAAHGELDLAELDIELGRLDGLEPRIRGINETFQRQRSVYGKSHASLVLARLKHAQGDLTEASRFIREAIVESRRVIPGVVTRHKGPYIRELVAIEAARILAAAGEAQDARAQLEFAASRARELRHVPLELEARLVEGEVELLVGSAESGRTLLEELQRDAEARGFVRIARRVESLLGESRSGM